MWIAEAVCAPSWPLFLRIYYHDAVVAGAFGALALRDGGRPSVRALLEVGGWCALLFVGPVLIAEGPAGHVESGLATLIFGMVPVVTVLIAAQQDEDAMRLLLPAVIGIAALGLVIPFSWPSSLPGVVSVAGMGFLVVGMALAGFRLHGLLQTVPIVWAATVGAAFSALAAGLGWAAGPHGTIDWAWKTVAIETAWGLIVDGALVWLVLWLLREMKPDTFSGRFLLIPAVTLIGGIILEKPEVGWTGWLGLVLAAGAGLVLARPKSLGFFG